MVRRTRPQMCNCTSGKLEIPGSLAKELAPRNDDGELQINFRFYLPFIWRPWRRHEFKASFDGVTLNRPWRDTPNASFHARFTCCNCAHPRPADGFAVDGPDRPARRQIRQ